MEKIRFGLASALNRDRKQFFKVKEITKIFFWRQKLEKANMTEVGKIVEYTTNNFPFL